MTPRLRRRSAAAVAIASLALASSAFAAFAPLPGSGAQVNDDPANSIDPSQSAGVVDAAGGTVVAGNVQVPWAAFEQRTGRRPADLRARLQGRPVGDPGLPGLAQPRPDQGGRGPVDRLRRRRSYDALGELVRAQRQPPRRRDQHLREPLQRGRQRLAAFGPGPHRRLPGPVAEHQHRPRGREPGRGRRRATAGADPVPWVAWQEFDGANAKADQRDQIFVSRAIKLTGATTCPPGTLPAGGAAVNGFCWQQVGIDRHQPRLAHVGRRHRPDAEHRPDPQRRRARRRLHRPERHRAVGRLVRGGPERDRPREQPDGVRGQGRQGRDRAAAASSGSPSATAPSARPTSSTPTGTHRLGSCAETPTPSGPAALNNDPQPSTPRSRASPPARSRPAGHLALGHLGRGDRRRPPRDLRLAAGGGDHFELLNNGQPVSNTVNDCAPRTSRSPATPRTSAGART